MDKLTHHLPQTRVDETTRKIFDELSAKDKRKLSNYLQIIYYTLATNYIERGDIFSFKKN